MWVSRLLEIIIMVEWYFVCILQRIGSLVTKIQKTIHYAGTVQARGNTKSYYFKFIVLLIVFLFSLYLANVNRVICVSKDLE